MKISKSIATVAGVLLALTGITGCGSTPGTVSGEPAPANSSDSGQEPVNTNAPKFGQTYTWKDGTSVTISAPEEFTPGGYASGVTEGWTNLKFTVTLANGSDESMTPVLFLSSILSGGKEGSQIFDSGSGIDFPTTDIPTGKSLEFALAYSVADASDLAMTVSPDSGLVYAKVAFTN